MELASGLRNRVSNLVNFPLEEEEGDEELLPLLFVFSMFFLQCFTRFTKVEEMRF